MLKSNTSFEGIFFLVWIVWWNLGTSRPAKVSVVLSSKFLPLILKFYLFLRFYATMLKNQRLTTATQNPRSDSTNLKRFFMIFMRFWYRTEPSITFLEISIWRFCTTSQPSLVGITSKDIHCSYQFLRWFKTRSNSTLVKRILYRNKCVNYVMLSKFQFSVFDF